MSEHKIPIPSMIYNAAVGGHITNSQQIIDEVLNKEQSVLNIEQQELNKGILEEKEYTSGSNNGMGRVVLRKNIVSGVNTLTQSMINKNNTIYVIQYDFTLGENITIPENCVLEFNGGSITTNGSAIKLSSGSKVYGGTIYTNGVSVFDITNCTDVIIDKVKCTNTIDARCFLVISTDTGNSHNIIVNNCICDNIGIIYNSGIFNVKATYNSNFHILNNICTIASSFKNRPDGIFLCYCEHFIIDGNKTFNTKQGITIWGGDGIHYSAWFDNTTQTVNFGTSDGIITNNEMETIGGSYIFIALGKDILVSNNIVKGQGYEALDAEFSKDITFDNNIVYSDDPFDIYGYRDNIVYSNNKVYLPDNFSGETAYMMRIVSCNDGEHYGEYNNIMGKCYIRDNYIDSNDNIVRRMSIDNLSFECVGNYIKNFYSSWPGIGTEHTYLNNTFKYTRNRDSDSYSIFIASNSGKFVFKGNKVISDFNGYLGIDLIVMGLNSNAIVKDNYIDLLYPSTLFITYNSSNICKVVFENNILSSRFREGNRGDLSELSGVGALSTFVIFYKHNIWEDNLKDIMFEDTNLTFYNNTKMYTTFTQGTILPKNEVSGSNVIVGKYCIADGTLSSSGNWKDIIL